MLPATMTDSAVEKCRYTAMEEVFDKKGRFKNDRKSLLTVEFL